MARTKTHRISVVVILQNAEDKVLLFERTGTESDVGVFVTGGGGVDAGEDVAKAACREMQEELGVLLKAEHLDLVGVEDRPDPREDGGRVLTLFFRARQWQGTPTNKEPNKHGEPVWYALNELPAALAPMQKKIFENHFKPQILVK